MKIAILQSNYIPWKGYFDLINIADVFCFYDEVQYTKNDWRNRNKIYSKNGISWLTIPVSKQAVKGKISEVVLENHRWQKKHFKTICQTYSKAPYLSNIKPLLEEVYLKRTWLKLSELNQHFIKKICEYIGIKTRIVNSANYSLKEGRIDRLLDLILQLEGTSYISGPSGKSYLQEYSQLFKENNINISYKSYDSYLTYKQNKFPFEHAVSTLDVLCFVPKNNLLQFISASK